MIKKEELNWLELAAKVTDQNNTEEVETISKEEVKKEGNKMTKEQAQRLDAAIIKAGLNWWYVSAKITDYNNTEEIEAAIKLVEAMSRKEAEVNKEEETKEEQTEVKGMKAIRINVYRTDRLGDCTNGGISSIYDSLLLVCEDGNIDIDENNLPENLVVIEEGYRGYKNIRPYKEPEHLGWMSGGNIGFSCNKKFRRLSEYPLKIHDMQ